MDDLAGFDDVVLATGVTPRIPAIPGIEHPKVLSYAEVLSGAAVGDSVAVIGAGGIGVRCQRVPGHRALPDPEPARSGRRSGAPPTRRTRRRSAALATPIPLPPAREVFLLQRTKGPQGRGLGKTIGLGAPARR